MSNEELAKLIHDGAHEKIIELWEQVKRFAMKKANKWLASFKSRSDVDFGDLVSTAYIAMCEAVESYKQNKGAFLSWYDYYLSGSFSALYGMRTERQKNDLLNTAVSLDMPVGSTEDCSLSEIVPDPDSARAFEDVEEDAYISQLHNALYNALGAIRPYYGDIVERRYFKAQTLKSIAEELGVNPNEVRRREAHGMNELRKPHIASKLRPFLDFDYCSGTGLSQFKNTGSSVQERYLLKAEIAEKCKQKKSAELLEKTCKNLSFKALNEQ